MMVGESNAPLAGGPAASERGGATGSSLRGGSAGRSRHRMRILLGEKRVAQALTRGAALLAVLSQCVEFGSFCHRFLRPWASSGVSASGWSSGVWGGLPCISVAEAKTPKYDDYYDVLGLPRDATTPQIKKKYRELSKLYHPDLNKDDASAQEKFTRIAQAYEVLADPEERKKFDRLGPEAYHEQKGGRGAPSDDFWGDFPFSSFFGGGRRRGREKSPSLKMRLHVTLDQLYFGDILHVSFRRPVLCMHVDDCLINRRDCGGEGVRLVQQQVGPGFIVQNQIADDTCIQQGKGWKAKCSKCPNGATEMEKTFMTANIERGMKEGDRLEFGGVGWQMLGKDAGDVFLEIVEQPNNLNLVRRGHNLYLDHHITLLDALVGFDHTLQHISGKDVPIKRNIVTADGEVEILKGWGMPMTDSNKFGDLHVTLRVQFPVELNAAQKQKVTEALGPVSHWKYTTVAKR